MLFLLQLYGGVFHRLVKYITVLLLHLMEYVLDYYYILKISQFWMISGKESDISSKLKNRVIIGSRNCTSSFIFKINENICKYKNRNMNVHSSITHDSQRWKKTKCLWWMNIQNEVYPYNWILVSNKKMKYWYWYMVQMDEP